MYDWARRVVNPRTLARLLTAAFFIEVRQDVKQAMAAQHFSFSQLGRLPVDLFREEALLNSFFDRLVEQQRSNDEVRQLACSLLGLVEQPRRVLPIEGERIGSDGGLQYQVRRAGGEVCGGNSARRRWLSEAQLLRHDYDSGAAALASWRMSQHELRSAPPAAVRRPADAPLSDVAVTAHASRQAASDCNCSRAALRTSRLTAMELSSIDSASAANTAAADRDVCHGRRVIDMGSVDGVSLVPLLHVPPCISGILPLRHQQEHCSSRMHGAAGSSWQQERCCLVRSSYSSERTASRQR